MRIGVLGGGHVGSALADRWTEAGHDVTVSARETIAETVSGADVILLAVPAGAAPDVLAAAGSLEGKVLVDAVVHLPLVLPPVVVGYLLLLLFGRGAPIGSASASTQKRGSRPPSATRSDPMATPSA